MAASRGSEPMEVKGMRRQGPIATVPGDGGVKEDMGVRKEERSAAKFTDPAKAKFGS